MLICASIVHENMQTPAKGKSRSDYTIHICRIGYV
jgi:hypothetical protein